MHGLLDTRPWNLFVGLALASGCSVRPSGNDAETGDGSTTVGDGTTTATDTSSSQTTASTTDGADECQVDQDCPPGYYCSMDGMCRHSNTTEGVVHNCDGDSDCETFELCVYMGNYDCVPQLHPDACGEPISTLPIPLLVPDAALALTFADVDADGADELVVASETNLHVFEAGVPDPSTTARGFDSASVTDIAGGQLDAQPGDDILVLHDLNVVDTHPSDGLGGFAVASEQVMAQGWIDGLVVDDFDGLGFDDVLSWGDGAVLETGAATIEVSPDQVFHATFRGPSSGAPGFSLLFMSRVTFYGLDGQLVSLQMLRAQDSAGALITVSTDGVLFDAGGNHITDWTRLEFFRSDGPGLITTWGVPGLVTNMAAGNLRGDTIDDILLVSDGDLLLWRDANDEGGCVVPVEHDWASDVVELAVGDHDGDGDDEIAVRLATGEVALLDDE